MFKKGLSFFLSIIMILTFTMAVGASNSDISENEKTAVGGMKIPTQEEYEAYLQSLTEEDLKKIAEKEKIAEELANLPMPRTPYMIELNNFMIYSQLNGYYCVPACVYSVLRYINGSSPSQNDIAKALGTGISTDPLKIAPYVNARQTFTYTFLAYPDMIDMCNKLYATIVSGYPCFLGMENSTGGGHCVVVDAIYSDKNIIEIADPDGDGSKEKPYYYREWSSMINRKCIDIVW